METQEFLGLHRYNAVNHYHLSESLLEEVLFWNPCAAADLLRDKNLSAENAGETQRQYGRHWQYWERNEENKAEQRKGIEMEKQTSQKDSKQSL